MTERSVSSFIRSTLLSTARKAIKDPGVALPLMVTVSPGETVFLLLVSIVNET